MSSIEKAMEKLRSKGAATEGKGADAESTDNTSRLVQEAAPESVAEVSKNSAELLKDSTGNPTLAPQDDKQIENRSASSNPLENAENLPEQQDIAEDSDQTTNESQKDSADELHKSEPSLVDSESVTPKLIDEDTIDINEKAAAVDKSTRKKSNYFEIDLALLDKNDIATQGSENRLLREQFRAIKRKIIQNAFGNIAETIHRPNLVIVTSCNPQEGKTFSALNLAMNIALEKDKTVLLVDADIVRPSAAKRLGMDHQRQGLTEFLSGDADDISDVIFSTNIENFKFVPAGIPHELSTELLASSRMNELANELSKRYPDRIVIFDAPPLLGVNETHILANLVGQALIVVVENQTKIADIQVASEQLDKEIAVGFLINKSVRNWNKQYGYGYSYGAYGHYHKD